MLVYPPLLLVKDIACLKALISGYSTYLSHLPEMQDISPIVSTLHLELLVVSLPAFQEVSGRGEPADKCWLDHRLNV